MATGESIAKAKAAGLILQQILGVEPSYDTRENYVRLYYQPDALVQAQSAVRSMATGPDADLRIDWLPIVTPYALGKVIPIAFGLVALGYILGKKL